MTKTNLRPTEKRQEYPGNNTVPRTNFSAPTFQVVYVFRRAIFALSTAWRINFFAE